MTCNECGTFVPLSPFVASLLKNLSVRADYICCRDCMDRNQERAQALRDRRDLFERKVV